MKTLLNEVYDKSGEVYQLYAELGSCDFPENAKNLTFYTVWSGSKNPKSEQIKYSFLLGPEAIFNLKKLLESK